MFYEWLRASSRRFDRRVARAAALRGSQGKGANVSGPGGSVSGRDSPAVDAGEEEGLLTGTTATGSRFKANLWVVLSFYQLIPVRRLTWTWSVCVTHDVRRASVPPFARVIRATLYAATVFLSFFLMLVFMTYNVSSLRNIYDLTRS